MRRLAKKFGASYEGIRCTVNRVTWKHVTFPEEKQK